MSKKDPDQLSHAETVRRRDDAIRRALSTPAKPLSDYVGKHLPDPPGRRPRKAKNSRPKAP
jgi:hypothetical protein